MNTLKSFQSLFDSITTAYHDSIPLSFTGAFLRSVNSVRGYVFGPKEAKFDDRCLSKARSLT
jgi:hypothetical protein